MEFPDNEATRLTERIMARIRDHLLPDEKWHPVHYNRVYTIVHEEASKLVQQNGAPRDREDAGGAAGTGS